MQVTLGRWYALLNVETESVGTLDLTVLCKQIASYDVLVVKHAGSPHRSNHVL
jgi:hypothetical protein